MKVGEQVRHIARPDVGFGRVERVYDDGHCDVVFGACTFSWIPLSGLVSVEREIALEELTKRLALGDVESARSYFDSHCSAYLTRPEFEEAEQRALAEIEKRHRDEEQARILAERQEARSAVHRQLQDGQFDAAESFYRAQCEDWWPEQEYTAVRDTARFVHAFVSRYAAASLSELDALHAADPIAASISAQDYAILKRLKVEMRLARLGLPLSPEQSFACAIPCRHRLIRARAGSGKTRTLAALAALVITDEQLNPDQVLTLAFNNKAASEIGERIRDAAGVTDYRNARTFHALAWRLADHGGRRLVFDDGKLQPSRQRQSQFVERAMKSVLNPAFQGKLYEFFRRELEQLDHLGFNLTEADYLIFRRALSDFTLAGEDVR